LRTRLAPTPSGYLHLGNAVNFVLTQQLAQRLGAELWLRIDDLDQARLRPEYLEDIDQTIQWLFPESTEQWTTRTVRQSERLGHYQEALAGMRAANLVFACTCSRRQVREAQAAANMPADVNTYPGTCRNLGLSLDAPDTVWRSIHGDIVVRQRNGSPSYQLASVVDDILLGMTHIMRGEDLLGSTEVQRVLAKAYAPLNSFLEIEVTHHPLITDAEGGKLSKSDGAASLRALRANGLTRHEVFAKADALKLRH